MEENAPVLTIQALPIEIIDYCLQLLSDEYNFWDLWRVGLVNKNFLAHVNKVQCHFARDTNLSSFATNIVALCQTFQNTDLEVQLRNYLKRYRFPEVTEAFIKSCGRCKEPIVTLMPVAYSRSAYQKRNFNTRRTSLVWCSAKNAILLKTHFYEEYFCMREYSEKSYSRYQVLSVDQLIATIVTSSEFILKTAKQD